MNKDTGRLIALCIPALMIGIDLLIMSVAINPISKDLHASLGDLQWFLSGYGIGLSCLLITAGKLADMFGRKKMYLLGLVFFVLGSVLVALSVDPLMVIISRILQGIGGAFILVTSLALVVHSFPAEKRTAVMGAIVATAGFGMGLGPVVGGLLIHFFSWRIAFWINLPIGIVALILGWLYFTDSKNEKAKPSIDLVGLLFLSLGIILLSIGLTQGNTWGWASNTTITVLVLAVLSFIILIWAECKINQPLIEFKLFLVKNFAAANIAGFLSYFIVMGWLFVFSVFLQRVYQFSPLMAGVGMLPFSVIYFLAGLVTAKIAKRISIKNTILFGFVFCVISSLILAFTHAQTPYFELAIGFAFMAIGFVFVLATSIPAALEFIPKEKAGLAAGKSMMFRWMGSAIGIVVSSAIFEGGSLHKATQLLAQHSDTLLSPQKLKAIVSGHIHLAHPSQSLINLLNQSYAYGVRASMWTLVGLSVLAFLVVLGMLKKKTA